MKIQIKHKDTAAVLYECEAVNLRAAVVAAVMDGANLRGANLRGANLRGADLGCANLRGADLGCANLYGADLGCANLRGANLRGANLYGANLYGADLRGADLRGANLYGANLYGANLGCAKLKDATITGDGAVVQIGPIGSRDATLVVFRTDKGLRLQTGCFYGDADTFLANVLETHGTNQHANNYRNALELAASMLGCDK